jgi:hypothetical protein
LTVPIKSPWTVCPLAEDSNNPAATTNVSNPYE